MRAAWSFQGARCWNLVSLIGLPMNVCAAANWPRTNCCVNNDGRAPDTCRMSRMFDGGRSRWTYQSNGASSVSDGVSVGVTSLCLKNVWAGSVGFGVRGALDSSDAAY